MLIFVYVYMDMCVYVQMCNMCIYIYVLVARDIS